MFYNWIQTHLLGTIPFYHVIQHSCFQSKDHGHILTGGLRIIDNNKLRNLFTHGPKYIESMFINFSLVARCSLLFARYSLVFAHCTLLFAHCSLLFARSLFVTFCSLLVTFCSLLVTFYSLLDKKFWRTVLSKSK